jgi:hypothetical protein
MERHRNNHIFFWGFLFFFLLKQKCAGSDPRSDDRVHHVLAGLLAQPSGTTGEFHRVALQLYGVLHPDRWPVVPDRNV